MVDSKESRYFQLLSTRVELAGPSEFLEPATLLFGRFEASPGPAALRYAVSPGGSSFDVAIAEAAHAETVRLPDLAAVVGFVYARVLDRVARLDPDLLCIHAAALSWNDRGVILPARSHHGKSTLALALAARGFVLFSDELAPVSRTTARLHPFPLAVGSRASAGDVLHGVVGTTECSGEDVLGKMRFDPPDEAAADSRPVPLSDVFVLEPEAEGISPTRRYVLTFDRPAPEVVPGLAAIEGVISAQAIDRGVLLAVRAGAWVAPRVESVLAGRSILVLTVDEPSAPAPDYGQVPRRDRLGAVEGVVALLEHLRGFGHLETLIAREDGGFAGLVANLGRRLRGVRFHRVVPGRLEAMVALVLQAVSEPGVSDGR